MQNYKFKIFCLFLTVIFFFTSTVAPALAAMTYTYDANGNQTSDGTKCYVYNEANQLKQVKNCSNNQLIAEYVYDYNGTRLIKKQYVNGVLDKTVYSPSDKYETTKIASGGATQNTSYYFANDQIIAKKDSTGNKTYFHNDHLGSSSVITDASGAVVESTKYDPWGEVTAGGTKSKFQYTGQEKDSETGLNYYNARYYDSHIKRFTQPDDYVQNIYDPQDLNPYSYVKNNPIRYTDPTGHFFVVDDALEIAAFLTVAPIIGNAFVQIAAHPEILEAAVGAGLSANASAESLQQGDYQSAAINLISAGVNLKGMRARGSIKGEDLTFNEHVDSNMVNRKWTKKEVRATVDNPVKIETKNVWDKRAIDNGGGKRNNDPATRYFAQDGHYVVINNKTKDVVQVSDRRKQISNTQKTELDWLIERWRK